MNLFLFIAGNGKQFSWPRLIVSLSFQCDYGWAVTSCRSRNHGTEQPLLGVLVPETEMPYLTVMSTGPH